MANIQTYLDNIARAIYGEEVRGSIYTAIDLINKMGEVNLSMGTAVNSETSPSTNYFDNSVYINENTWDVWKCKGTGSGWTLVGNLKGSSIGAVTKTGVKPNSNNLIDQYSITTENGVEIGTFEIVNGCPIIVNRNKNQLHFIVRNPDGTNTTQDITQPNKFGTGTAITAENSSLSGYYTGDLYFNTSTNDFWRCENDNGTIWTKIANIKGDQGIQGIQGYSIDSIERQSQSGLVDTYIISNDNDDVIGSFTVTNGQKGDKGDKGDRGDDGTNGYSPTVTSSKSGKITTITITDIAGPHTFELRDGNDGDSGGDMLRATYDADDDGVVDMAMTLSPNTIDTVPTSGSGHVVTSGGLYAYLGNLNDLNTDEKTNLVAAINEAAESAGHSDEYVQKTGDAMTGILEVPKVKIGRNDGLITNNTSSIRQVVMGKNNKIDNPDDYTKYDIFQYGNGISTSSRSNLIEVSNEAGILIGSKFSSTSTKGTNSIAIGAAVEATGSDSVAFGCSARATAYTSFAQGEDVYASEKYSHAEGNGTRASNLGSHSEGRSTRATGEYSHAEGNGTYSSGNYSHSEGESTQAIGVNSHAEGKNTIANYANQHVSGIFNNNKENNLFEIGNGVDVNNRSNAFEVDKNGNAIVTGTLSVNGSLVPKITYGTTDLTAGESALETGSIYIVYE